MPILTTTRVISLDFDGCTHPSPQLVPRREDVPALAWLDELAMQLEPHPDVGLLVHSSWRENYAPAELEDMLHPLSARFVGVAPVGLPRAEAIKRWLDAHPGVSLLAVDDEPGEFNGFADIELVVCDPRFGLSGPDVQKAVRAWLERTALDSTLQRAAPPGLSSIRTHDRR